LPNSIHHTQALLCQLCLRNAASENASGADAEEVRGRLSAAGRDCVPRERNSIVAFQSRTGVEVGEFALSVDGLSFPFLVFKVFDGIVL
jgi:hypothetical protein